MKPLSPFFLLVPLMILVFFSTNTYSSSTSPALFTEKNEVDTSTSSPAVFTEANEADAYSSSPTLITEENDADTSLSDGTNARIGSGGYTNYSLVLQFTKSLCNFPNYYKRCDSSSKTSLPNRFTIHGLWPNFGWNRKPSPPSPPEKLLISKLLLETVLLNKLYNDWPDAYFVSKNIGGDRAIERKHSVYIWTHEWDDHGVHSDFHAIEYLKETQILFNDLGDIYGEFSLRRLIIQGMINATMASEVLTQKFGVKPLMKCLFNSKGEQHLFEIHFTIRRGDLERLSHSQSPPEGHNCTGHMVRLQI
ncbi:hypothetical protein MKW98_004994 [Papaver atlanticum]|uniref:Uncharacterized protein n=1 Tax=Papaver atlanticum TaxID=357466 RepID=A0AAD4TGA9_9MAGN|nr:hypothetical protein MKW98_004994 [Papaver atlanticum]